MSRRLLHIFLAFAFCLASFIPTSLMVLAASPSITLSPTSGPPSIEVKVSGNGFGSREVVKLFFDTTHVGSATTNNTGAFGKNITIPGSAQPGTHTVQATGQSSGRSAQAAFLVQANWPMFGFFASHDHYNFYENVLSPTNVSGLTLDWNYNVGSYDDSSPIVYQGIVYSGSSNALDALDATTGVLKWSYPIAGYVSPAVGNGVVYVSSNKTLDALNGTTGTLLWSYTVSDMFGISTSITFINNVVYFGTGSALYALDATAGTLKWHYAVNCINGIFSTPAVASGVVYFDTGCEFDALNAKTGTFLWKDTTTGFAESSPAVANGMVYYLYGYYLRALDATTGALKWQHTFPKSQGSSYDSSPAVANGIVYIGVELRLYALNAMTGKPLWNFITGKQINSSPSVANGVVYIGSEDHSLYALDATAGTFLWHYMTGGSIYESSPTVVNGMVFISSGDDKLYAFHLPGKTP